MKDNLYVLAVVVLVAVVYPVCSNWVGGEYLWGSKIKLLIDMFKKRKKTA